jgi:hypothetical protein
LIVGLKQDSLDCNCWIKRINVWEFDCLIKISKKQAGLKLCDAKTSKNIGNLIVIFKVRNEEKTLRIAIVTSKRAKTFWIAIVWYWNKQNIYEKQTPNVL